MYAACRRVHAATGRVVTSSLTNRPAPNVLRLTYPVHTLPAASVAGGGRIAGQPLPTEHEARCSKQLWPLCAAGACAALRRGAPQERSSLHCYCSSHITEVSARGQAPAFQARTNDRKKKTKLAVKRMRSERACACPRGCLQFCRAHWRQMQHATDLAPFAPCSRRLLISSRCCSPETRAEQATGV